MSQKQSRLSQLLMRTDVKIGLGLAMLVWMAYMFSWWLAIISLAALLAHEYGHVLAFRFYGIPMKGVWVIPFLGAIAVPAGKRMPSQCADVFISIMGPVGGLLFAIPTLVLCLVTRDEFWAKALLIQAVINLFNLLPVFPLDAGRIWNAILASVHPTISVWYAGFCVILAGAAVFFLGMQPIFLFLLLVAFLGYSQLASVARLRKERSLVESNLELEEDMLLDLEDAEEQRGGVLLLPGRDVLDPPRPLSVAIEEFEEKCAGIEEMMEEVPRMTFGTMALSAIAYSIVIAAFLVLLGIAASIGGLNLFGAGQ